MPKKNAQSKKTRSVVPRFTKLGKQIYGFPPTLLTRLRYCDSYIITSTTGAVGKQVMLVNSIFDPDSTGVGHQPLYRDTYASLYDQYAVVSAKVKLTFITNGATAPMIVGALIDDDTTTSTTYYVLMEQSKGKHMALAGATGSLSRDHMTLEWNCREQLGIDPFTSETYKSAVGSNPTEQQSLLIWASTLDGLSTANVSVLLEIDFEVYFTELATQIGS